MSRSTSRVACALALGLTLTLAAGSTGCDRPSRLEVVSLRAERLADDRVTVDLSVRCIGECGEPWCARATWYQPEADAGPPAPGYSVPLAAKRLATAEGCVDERLHDGEEGSVRFTSSVPLSRGATIGADPTAGASLFEGAAYPSP